MSKSKHVIRFHNIYQLWAYAQLIHASNIEIKASEMTLICDCSDEDLKKVSTYHGEVIETIIPVFNHTSKNLLSNFKTHGEHESSIS